MATKCHVCRTACSYRVCFVLKPCNHVACIKCFHQFVPASFALQCPCSGCQEWVQSSVLLEVNSDQKDPENKAPASTIETGHEHDPQSTFVQEVIHFEPDEQMDPFRHWAMKKPDLYSGFIYAAFRCNDEEASFYKTNFKAANSTVFLDDDSSDDLIKIFARVLHPLLFRKDFAKHHDRDATSCSPKMYDLPPHGDHERQDLALRSLYALSSGRVMSPNEQQQISCGSLESHSKIKQKAVECAKNLAKELLISKRMKRHNTAACTPMNRTGTSRKRRVLLSPIIENQEKSSDENHDHISQCRDALPGDLEMTETQVPYILGILLLGAAWMISQ